MRQLHYASGSVLTGDIVSAAVLRYARALAESGRYDVVSIPVFVDGEADGRAHLLLGPSSELFSTPAPGGGGEPSDTELVRQLEVRARQLRPRRADWDKDPPELSQSPTDISPPPSP